MKPPTGLRAFVGLPIVTLAINAFGAYCLFIAYVDPSAMVLGLAAVFVMGWTIDANSQVTRYRAWKRAWEGMSPGASRSRPAATTATRIAALTMIVGAVGYFLHTNADQPGFRFALGWLMGGVLLCLLAALIMLIRRMARWLGRGRTRAAKSPPISISAQRPVLPVPSLEKAYNALPEHCWRVLGK